MTEIRIYRTEKGRQPFIEWYDRIKDRGDRLRISKRLRQIELGSFGDSKSVGSGVYELRFFFGKGYRVYYARDGEDIILLLCGGDKSGQQRDIEKAGEYWKDYKKRNI